MAESQWMIFTYKNAPHYVNEASSIIPKEWPHFIFYDFSSIRFMPYLYQCFPDYQFCLINLNSKKPVAIANSIPIRWEEDLKNLPDEGWDWALEYGFKCRTEGVVPNTLCALSITIDSSYQGLGLSSVMISFMKTISNNFMYKQLLVPARPTLKHLHPFMPMDSYLKKKNDKNELYDPWLRTHKKIGGKIIRICNNSMIIKGTLSNWSAWTGVRFTSNFQQIVPKGLVPVIVEIDLNEGTYIEPNIWIVHKL